MMSVSGAAPTEGPRYGTGEGPSASRCLKGMYLNLDINLLYYSPNQEAKLGRAADKSTLVVRREPPCVARNR